MKARQKTFRAGTWVTLRRFSGESLYRVTRSYRGTIRAVAFGAVSAVTLWPHELRRATRKEIARKVAEQIAGDSFPKCEACGKSELVIDHICAERMREAKR